MATQENTALPIEVRGLSKTYRLGFFLNRKVRALEGLDMRVEPGQVYGLLGPNGAGKSTTIKILMNLVQPTAGTALLFGLPPEQQAARRHIGFLPENPAPYEYLTGTEFVTLGGRLAGLSGHELDQRVREVISSVGMERGARLQIRRYSKGMIQRIALAQALVHRPRLLVLDEPTSGLDPVGRRQMRDLILEERARGTTVLFCTHIIPDVEALCDRVVVLVGGRQVREGSVQELLTAQAPLMELTLEGVSAEVVGKWGIAVEYTQAIGQRLLVRAQNAQAQALLQRSVQEGVRVSQLSPVRFSLEDLFLQALAEAGHSNMAGVEVQ